MLAKPLRDPLRIKPLGISHLKKRNPLVGDHSVNGLVTALKNFRELPNAKGMRQGLDGEIVRDGCDPLIAAESMVERFFARFSLPLSPALHPERWARPCAMLTSRWATTIRSRTLVIGSRGLKGPLRYQLKSSQLHKGLANPAIGTISQ